MSQEALAAELQMDRTTVGRIEAGRVPYNQDFLEACARVLHCSAADLISGAPGEADARDALAVKIADASPHVRAQIEAVVSALLATAD